jgi:hypothetical protein
MECDEKFGRLIMKSIILLAVSLREWFNDPINFLCGDALVELG